MKNKKISSIGDTSSVEEKIKEKQEKVEKEKFEKEKEKRNMNCY